MENCTLNFYCASSPGSKSYWAFDALERSWPYKTQRVDGRSLIRTGINVFWGFVGHNRIHVEQCDLLGLPYIFIDMPYWGRWHEGMDASQSYWRICVNKIHANTVEPRPSDRADRLNIELRPWRTNGREILVCPSSRTLNIYLKHPHWESNTVNDLKGLIDIDKTTIRVRHKPRANGTSGPSVADISFDQDCAQTRCVITSASISAVEAVCLGIPSISGTMSPAAPMSGLSLDQVQDLFYPDRQNWVNNLAYNQWTIQEIEQGLPIAHILSQLKI